MPQLSKSKLIAFRQCPKRLWLELHKPELRDDTGSEAAFASGHAVGAVAQSVLDRVGDGVNVDPNLIGWDEAYAQTDMELKEGKRAVFEAALQIPGALALADVMRPDPDYSDLRWEMIEVKASASVKDYHRDDIAIQSYIARQKGIPLSKVGLAHIDTGFVYPGGENYNGLFHIEDLTDEALSREAEVEQWLSGAQVIAALDEAPEIEMGAHCTTPFDCGFCKHCGEGREPEPEDPLAVLPRLNWKKRESFALQGFEALEDIPDDQLSETQAWVKSVHLSGEPFFDQEVAQSLLAPYPAPIAFLDFETVSFSVPVWPGTRPYQNLPFQYSLHRINADGSMDHREFLQLDGADPREALARQMIDDCGTEGATFVYNASFERKVIQELAENYPGLQIKLLALVDRLVDLWPIAKACYYHPGQNGTWSLKAVAPAIAPDIAYDALDGVQVGSDAGVAYLEACAPETSPERREELRQQMLAYCKLDTLATVRIWEYFKSGTR